MAQKQTENHGSRQVHWLRNVGTALVVLAVLATAVFLHIFVLPDAPRLPVPPLKDLAAADGVELGMQAEPDRLGSGAYRQILASQFSFVTADGPINGPAFEPAPNTYNFKDMDAVVDFAEAHGLAVQAHHLVWNEDDSLPKWLKTGNYTKQQLSDIMHAQIDAIVGRYKGKVTEWSVVNEPFTRAAHMYGLDNWWGDHLGGMGYIDDALRWARAADPSAKLILNDFYNEVKTSVSDAEYAYVKGAKARGVPIDGIGMQMHIDASQPPEKAAIIANMQRFAALGVPVYITEFDINANTVQGSAAYKAQLEARLSAMAVEACVESKACVSFTVFGMTDQNSFIKWLTRSNSRSHLFTSRYQPTQSFDAFRAAWLRP